VLTSLSVSRLIESICIVFAVPLLSLFQEELREMIERADLDGDGAISQDEFFNIMTKKTFQ
jgi:hypothetical protein